MRTVYLNGRYIAENEATVSIFDRGFLFADAIYEVTAVFEGRLVDFAGHTARLDRSLREIGIRRPVSDEELLSIHRELVRLNGLNEGLIYLGVTRGNAGDRDFLYPGAEVAPTIVLFSQEKALIDDPAAARGLRVITAEDLRWGRGDIKTVQLLYASMVKNRARDRGADDAWLVRDGFVTEGASNNAYIVTNDGRIVTRQLSTDILGGITRAAILQCAADLQLRVEERPFSLAEVAEASEAFLTSAGGLVSAVVQVDATVIGSGKPGPMASRLRQIYIERSRASAV